MASRWVCALTAVMAVGCSSSPPAGPACLFMPTELRIVWNGPSACRFREDSLPRPWFDLAGCEVRMRMPEGVSCDVVGGRALGPEDGRAWCRIERLEVTDRSVGAPPPDGMGWFFDDFTTDMPCPIEPSPNEIRFLPEPPLGTDVELSCVVTVPSDAGANASCFYPGEVCDPGLACDPVRDRCSAPCTRDEDCEAAGLEGWICDRRPRSAIDPRERDDTPNDFCANPTCEIE